MKGDKKKLKGSKPRIKNKAMKKVADFFLINFLYFDQYDLPMISLKYSKFK